MKRLLKIDNNMIMREKDKMIFSAKKMKIFKFNDRGFLIVKLLYVNKIIEERELFNMANNIEEISEEEFIYFIDKLIDSKVVLEDNE